MCDLINMINHGRITLEQFFTMHPFSLSDTALYNQALAGIDFFEELYVKSDKTYEHLITLCDLIKNANKNLLIITGYRGCGKTNFVKFIEHIANGYTLKESFYGLYEQDQKMCDDELKRVLKKDYDETLQKIIQILNDRYYGKDYNYISNDIPQYISKTLKSLCIYINFDKGKLAVHSSKKVQSNPLIARLVYKLRNEIEYEISASNISNIINIQCSFIEQHIETLEEHFEYHNDKQLNNIWQRFHDDFSSFNDKSTLDNFLSNVSSLSLDRVLLVYMIWKYASLISRNSCDTKILYLMDNIDIISDNFTDIFDNTMQGIWAYVWQAKNFFTQLKETMNNADDFIKLYDNTNFVVAMREITVMHISGHLRDRLRSFSDHFDMSSDIDKTLVVQKKIDLAFKLIRENSRVSAAFKDSIFLLNRLTNDRVFMQTLFKLYNNDYRTSMCSLLKIFTEHPYFVNQALNHIESKNPYRVFGGRGIIYRIIIDAFFSWSYFDPIGVPASRNIGNPIKLKKNYNFSCARIILTMLCNKQAKNPERFFKYPHESVKLVDLYNSISCVITDMDDFLKIIDGIYSLRDKDFWNHLITFDNIKLYSINELSNHLKNKNNIATADNRDIYLRATPAGQSFVENLSVHFEYFASRYSSIRDIPLFSISDINNETFTKMKTIVNDVYESVHRCCRNLEKYNRQILKNTDKVKYSAIVGSSYFYEQQFHEERIIHSHITYLDSYRYFLVNNCSEEWVVPINKFLTSAIKKYLNLLKYDLNKEVKPFRDLFYSENSRNLYNELNVCRKHIVEDSLYSDTYIMITREFYNNHYKGEEYTQ